MKIIAKSSAATTLLFCFLSVTFHSFTHFHNHHEKEESHFPDSREHDRHNISEQCDECLNKDKKSHDSYFSEIGYLAFFNTYDYGFENYIKFSFPFNLHCRPPPRATA